MAGPTSTRKKLLFIFLRGGIDGVDTVIPYGDQGIPGQGIKTYLEARPTIGIPSGQAHGLTSDFAKLHPSLQSPSGEFGPQVQRIFHGNLDERGAQLALLHRIGYEAQNRSHFSSEQFWENAVPGEVKLEKGVFNNYVTSYPDDAELRALTVHNDQMVIMKGETLIPVLSSVEAYSLPSNVTLGAAPSPGAPLGSGLAGAYGQPFDASRPTSRLTYETGRSLVETLQFFEANVLSQEYLPEAEANPYYDAMSDRVFARSVRDCARLLKQIDTLQITGCNQDGYDTHGSQALRLSGRLEDLGLALTALFYDLKPIWENTLVMTLSEFGRTSEENGNLGTDHGESSLMVMMGGSVNGGVYNCDPTTWDHGDLFSTPTGRYVAHRTDYRAVYGEIFQKHLGDPEGRMDSIVPGYSELAAANSNGFFTPLGFLA